MTKDDVLEMKITLRNIVSGDINGISDLKLDKLTGYLESMVTFFCDTDNAMNFYLAQKVEQCKAIQSFRRNNRDRKNS